MNELNVSTLIGPISPAAPGTLYQQIIDGFKRAIAEERIRPGDALPSFRSLAGDLLVSLITVKRAYEELERAGIIYSRQGLGTFVAERGDDRSRQGKIEKAREQFQAGIREAAEAGLNPQEILNLIRQELEQKKTHSRS